MVAGVALAVVVIVILAVGAVAGWIAGKIMEGRGYGFWTNAGLGILGALVGSLLFAVLGIAVSGLFGAIVRAVVGAVVVLAIANWRRRRRGI